MDYLFNTRKIEYIKGKKPSVDCILCAVREHNPEVKNLEVLRADGCIACVNLYPFNPGHLMIFPERHVADVMALAPAEAAGMHRLLCRLIEAIRDEFAPTGFNVGYNLGIGSGASIPHVHQHIVPRYENEIGFLDVLAGARVVVVDPVEVMERLRKRFNSC